MGKSPRSNLISMPIRYKGTWNLVSISVLPRDIVTRNYSINIQKYKKVKLAALFALIRLTPLVSRPIGLLSAVEETLPIEHWPCNA